MTATATDGALMAAARALAPDLPDDVIAVPAPAGYGRATLFVTVNQAEHERRAGGPPVTRIEYLELLLALPVGMPVPVGSLAGRERALLGRLPAGAVRVEGGRVTRLAVRPATVHLALVTSPMSEKGIGVASGFAPFCARAINTPTRPDTEVLVKADYWGIGVAHDGETLVEPAPWRPMRHTAAGWLFVERAYQAAVDGELLGAKAGD